ncbi:uncharacterized protein LOC132710251 isoform X2 [Pantherophis guttatus]|uniref:Eukaryotic translation initiation factor 1b isoform X2 n=1 Tax=Pantherophis guttatus TaxID=94885 RepID=A0ABM3YU54_PANGU|nr:eukaryotic translation initiation factor 1b isoform X2 [Pantherophis guttatus]XP_060541960.1 uncharacterized protein LOC132710251 isoform X2 [Pantherophis guttatus]
MLDPFADATKGDNLLPAGTEDYIHIRIQQRNGRKTLTTVQGIADDYDKKKLVKAFKKVGLNMRPYQCSVRFRTAGPPTALQASFPAFHLPQLLGEPGSQVRSTPGQRPQRHDPVQSSSGRPIPGSH